MAYYVDTSALIKLVVEEDETTALMGWLGAEERTAVSCDLARTELVRATRRAAPDQMGRARQVLDGLILTEVTTAVFEAAGRLDPKIVRSLDAIHLAAALDLGDDLDGIITYDTRLADAARAHGIPVIAPS